MAKKQVQLNWLITLKQAAQIRTTPAGWLAEETNSVKSWPAGLSAAKQAVERAFNAAASPGCRSPSTDSKQFLRSSSVNSTSIEQESTPMVDTKPGMVRFRDLPLVIPPSPSSTLSSKPAPKSPLSPLPSLIPSPLSRADAKSASPSGLASSPSFTKGKISGHCRKRKARDSPNTVTPKRKMTHLVGHVDVPPSRTISRPSLPGFSETLSELQTFLDPTLISARMRGVDQAVSPRSSPDAEPEVAQLAEKGSTCNQGKESPMAEISETSKSGKLGDWMLEEGNRDTAGQQENSASTAEPTTPDSSSTGRGCLADSQCRMGASSPISVLAAQWSLSLGYKQLPALSPQEEATSSQDLANAASLADGHSKPIASPWCDSMQAATCQASSGAISLFSLGDNRMEDSLAAVMASLVQDMSPMTADGYAPAEDHACSAMAAEDIKTGLHGGADTGATHFCLDAIMPSGELQEADGTQWLSDVLLPGGGEEGDSYAPLSFVTDL